MSIDKKVVKIEIKPMNSDYFICNLVGYNKDDYGIYSGGFTSYNSALEKAKELVGEENNS